MMNHTKKDTDCDSADVRPSLKFYDKVVRDQKDDGFSLLLFISNVDWKSNLNT